MSGLEIRQFPCLRDNYGVLIHDAASGQTASVDTPDEGAVRDELKRLGLKLTHIFTTHDHPDHVAGHAGLKRETGCKIYGAAKDEGSIPGLDVALREGDSFAFGGYQVQVLETPGHTAGHIAFIIPQATGPGSPATAFVGDTLFSVGCGRILGGNAETMWASLQKLTRLPPETMIYCGHEYTQSNIAFALTVEPGNKDLAARKVEVDEARGKGQPTVPVSLSQELKTNPFLRVDSAEIRSTLGMDNASGAEVFTELRRRKDRF
jgi:hydroxyacylglutathione hydrolase